MFLSLNLICNIPSVYILKTDCIVYSARQDPFWYKSGGGCLSMYTSYIYQGLFFFLHRNAVFDCLMLYLGNVLIAKLSIFFFFVKVKKLPHNP